MVCRTIRWTLSWRPAGQALQAVTVPTHPPCYMLVAALFQLRRILNRRSRRVAARSRFLRHCYCLKGLPSWSPGQCPTYCPTHHSVLGITILRPLSHKPPGEFYLHFCTSSVHLHQAADLFLGLGKASVI